jgi:hypothetical protein
MKLLFLLMLFDGCATDYIHCAGTDVALTAQPGVVPPTARLGVVPDVPEWPLLVQETVAEFGTSAWVAQFDTEAGSVTESVPGVLRLVGAAAWFVPADILPSGAVEAQFGPDRVVVEVDKTATTPAPDAPPAPAVSAIDDGGRRPHVDIEAFPTLASGWYDIAWSVDGGPWSEAAAWSGAAFRLYGETAADARAIEYCTAPIPIRRRQDLAVRVRVVALDGTPGPWSQPASAQVR